MNDTPRTDAIVRRLIDNDQSPDQLEHFAKELERELNASNQRIKRLEETLRRIANTDYRGNRSTESQIAFEALNETKP